MRNSADQIGLQRRRDGRSCYTDSDQETSQQSLGLVKEKATKLTIGSLVDKFDNLVSTLYLVSAELVEKEDENLKLRMEFEEKLRFQERAKSADSEKLRMELDRRTIQGANYKLPMYASLGVKDTQLRWNSRNWVGS